MVYKVQAKTRVYEHLSLSQEPWHLLLRLGCDDGSPRLRREKGSVENQENRGSEAFAEGMSTTVCLWDV